MYAAEHVCCAHSFLVHLVLLLLFGLFTDHTFVLLLCCRLRRGD
jgi:hypothetical protein